MEKSRIKKIGRVILNVIIYIFLAVCICAVILTLFSKRDSDGAAEIFGYQMRIVSSSSMEKCEHTDVSDYEIKSIPLRSMIFIQLVPEDEKEADEWYGELEVGDVLTFRYVYHTKQETITHRITSITEKETGGYIIELEGDNKNSDSDQLYQTIDTSVPYSTNYVIGKVTGQARVFGAIMSFLMEPYAMILVVILPCVIIMLIEILKIVKVIAENKRAKQLESQEKENQEKEDEIAELRRKLAELEKTNGEKASLENHCEENTEKNGGDKE